MIFEYFSSLPFKCIGFKLNAAALCLCCLGYVVLVLIILVIIVLCVILYFLRRVSRVGGRAAAQMAVV